MNTYILVHGAWHGSWCWENVAKQLIAQGHTVYTPDLPGHFNNPCDFHQVTLQLYVKAVQEILRKTDCKVILVGHSMAGVVISQVAENYPEKIACLVYISGFIPAYNGSLVMEEEKASKPSVSLEVKLIKSANIISIKESLKLKQLFYNKCREDDAAYALSLLQDQPLQPFFDKVSLSIKKFDRVKKFYIECLHDQAIAIEDQRRMYSRTNCLPIILSADHSPFFSDVIGLTNALITLK